MKQAALFVIALSFACVLLPSLSNAEIYQYVDKSGTIVMVDDVTKVPEEYRANMQVRGGRRHMEKSAVAAAASTQKNAQELLKNLTADTSPQASQAPQVFTGQSPQEKNNAPETATLLERISTAFDRPGLKILIAVIAAAAALLVISKTAKNLGAKKAAVLICILLTGAVAIFLFRVSMQKAADKVADVMKNVEGIKVKLDGRETSKSIAQEFKTEPDVSALNAAPVNEKSALTMPLPPRD